MPELGWDNILSIAIPLLAIVPAWIAVQAYRRTRTARVLFFTSAFSLFFLKGVVIAAEVLFWEGNAALDAAELLGEALILVLFTLGMVKG